MEGADPDGGLVDAYRWHASVVFGLAARVCGRSGADDITQEVFIRLWRHPERFDPARGSLRTFLLTMTHNLAVDRVRSSDARRNREERYIRQDPIIADDVAAEALSGVTRQQVVAALNGLPPGERDAIVTAFYGRCTYHEAAQILAEPTGTIKGRIRAGLRHLRSALSDSIDEEQRAADHTPPNTSPHEPSP
ncbi:MAG: sigma-70 family RNA polymerase sigma factor [Acidimicrobiales bacterium]